MNKKIVIISYSTFPNNSPRSNRTRELSEELSRQGHDVSLYTLTGNYNYDDYMEETGIKIKSLGPTYLFNFDYAHGGFSQNILMKNITRIFGKYLALPSIELILNTYNSLKKESDIDLLITIAVPYPLHWGAALYRHLNSEKLENTIWAADCGDPYMGNDFSSKPFYFKYVEKHFCRLANYITVPVESAKSGYYSEFLHKIKVIPQGFNISKRIEKPVYQRNSIPTFIYAGTFYETLRDPRPLLDYLASLNRDFLFIIYTKSDYLIESYKSRLGHKIKVLNYIPREKLIYEMSRADFLINLENPTAKQSPSKLIDYTLANRPILSINSNKDLDINLVDEFLNAKYHNQFKLIDFDQYDIKNVANQFLALADNP